MSNTEKIKKYCDPSEAGLSSSRRAVAHRLRRLIEALETEINDYVVDGQIVEDMRDFKLALWERVNADGIYEVSHRRDRHGVSVKVRRKCGR